MDCISAKLLTINVEICPERLNVGRRYAVEDVPKKIEKGNNYCEKNVIFIDIYIYIYIHIYIYIPPS